MADMMDTLKGLLGDDADEKINTIMNALNKPDGDASSPSTAIENTSPISASPAISPELLLQAQGLLGQLTSAENDNRANLLLSLKPYMRSGRRDSIDSALKMLNIARLSQLFKGGILS